MTPQAGATPTGPTAGTSTNPHFEYLCRLADDRLILGHRLSEWCGHAPILEEDIALANIALDFVGQASSLLKLAGELEGKGRDDDALAFHRDAYEFRNVCLVEQPNGDFAHTIVRQFLFDAFDVPLLRSLTSSSNSTLAGIAAKALKEAQYHLRHSSTWVVRLGDGTEESHQRMISALGALAPYASELFYQDATDLAVMADAFGADGAGLREEWEHTVKQTLQQATLPFVTPTPAATLGRKGRHSEHLGHLLAVMQILPRSNPGAQW